MEKSSFSEAKSKTRTKPSWHDSAIILPSVEKETWLMGPRPTSQRARGLVLLPLGCEMLTPSPPRSLESALLPELLLDPSSLSLSSTSSTPLPKAATNCVGLVGDHLTSMSRALLSCPPVLNLPRTAKVMPSMSSSSPFSRPTMMSRFSSEEVRGLMAQHARSAGSRFSRWFTSVVRVPRLSTHSRSPAGSARYSTPGRSSDGPSPSGELEDPVDWRSPASPPPAPPEDCAAFAGEEARLAKLRRPLDLAAGELGGRGAVTRR
mmetsp:Transcript_71270/g.190279  ORF Transcript_71270/g.190279 Transcript_71270/m.190279 type:complete len:263 (+) Transcript_71270:661-1449(+)